MAAPGREESFDVAVACWAAINKSKADAALSMGREVERLGVAPSAATLAQLEAVREDVMA